MIRLIFAFIVLTLSAIAEEPWGCDSELAQRCYDVCCPSVHDDIMVQATRSLIRFHKGVISPADGPRSHFKPSSSEYMLQAVEKHGFLQGYLMGCDRLMRENNDPWVYRTILGKYRLITKWDPVP